MSRENLEAVRMALEALNGRDVDAYLACCTDDVQLRTPLAPIEGVHEGAEGIRRFFTALQDSTPDFRLDVERMEAVGPDRVLAFLRASASGRASGIAVGDPITNVYNLAEGKIRRIRVFADRQQALEAVGLGE
jgi:ketosteroid isomerase-like protein